MFVAWLYVTGTEATVTWNALYETKSCYQSLALLLEINQNHYVMRCWSTWAIILYDRLCALNLRNVNEPAGLSGSLLSPGPSVSVKRDCLDLPLSPSLSLTWPHNPTDSNRLFPEQSMRGPAAAVNNSRSVVHLSTKERQTDGWTCGWKWMDGSS